jgi:hypothetical protein
METNEKYFHEPRVNHELRWYILHQGESIKRIHEVLNSKRFRDRLANRFFLCLELLLYPLIAGVLYMMASAETPEQGIHGVQQNSLAEKMQGIPSENYLNLYELLCLLIVLLGLTLAIILRKSRKKINVMNYVRSETREMRENFERASKTMKW